MTRWPEAKAAILAVLLERFGSDGAIAAALGVNRSQVSRWFRGYSTPRIEALQDIAAVCPETRALIRDMF